MHRASLRGLRVDDARRMVDAMALEYLRAFEDHGRNSAEVAAAERLLLYARELAYALRAQGAP
jgi:hypothetical protein